MRKRNDGNAIQAAERTMSPQESAGALRNGYSANIELIRIAQSEGGESEAAMRATAELLELIRPLAMSEGLFLWQPREAR